MNIKIKEITKIEYNDFIKNINIDVFQTINYLKSMKFNNYKYSLLGFYLDTELIAISCILYKSIYPFCKYAFIPGGIIYNNTDNSILIDMLQILKDYCKKKNYCFVKIMPFTNNLNYENILKALDFRKRKINNKYNYILPNNKIILKLNDFNYNNIAPNYFKYIKENNEMNITIQDDMLANLKSIYSYDIHIKSFKYYEQLYKTFDKENLAAIKTIYVNKEKLLENSTKYYNIELIENEKKYKEIQTNPNEKLWKEKNDSDNNLIRYKTNIDIANNKNSDLTNLAGVLILKNNKTINILLDSYNKKYKSINSNISLIYQLIEEYKNNFDYLIIHTYDNNYNEIPKIFNMTKISYNGEYDLIINEFIFNQIKSNRKFSEEFLNSTFNKSDPIIDNNIYE